MAFAGYKIILKLNGKKNTKKISVALFVLCFSMFCAVMWEFIEFTSDFFFLTDLQKDRIVNNFNSKKLNNSKSFIVNDIEYTIIYDSSNNEIVKLDGYLDIGIIDTIKDMFVNFLGALTFSIILYIKRE